MTRPFNRRSFLRRAGLGTLAMLPGLWGHGRPVHARSTRPPTRFLLLTNSYGTIRHRWRMRPAGSPSGDFNFDLTSLPEEEWSEILRPLYPLRHQLSVLEGMSQMTVQFGRDGDLGAWGHSPSHVTTVTGSRWWVPESEASKGGGDRHCAIDAHSIDQVIADHVAQPGQLSSIELGRTAFRFRDGVPMPSEENPAAAFDRVFGDLDEPEQLEPDTRRTGALEVVMAELETISERVSASNRQRLQTHRDLVAGLHDRLSNPLVLDCEVPTLSGDDRTQMFQLIQAAFVCDATRVISYNIGELAPAEFGYGGGVQVHGDLAHLENDDVNSAGSQGMTAMYVEIARRFSELLGLLDTTPDPYDPESSLLDNTAVLWMTEQEDGEHGYRDVPVILAGGAAGRLQPGGYHRFDTIGSFTGHIRGSVRTEPFLRGQNHALVTAAQAMDVDTNTVGAQTLVDLEGRTIDLTGPLPGVLSS